MLEARGLTKRFSGVTAVGDVSFAIRPGEVLGYLGPNGSGKSTTVKMLIGLLEPNSGTVLYDGQDVSRDHVALRRHVGYVPEEPNLYPFLSGREYLQLVGRLRELPPRLIDRKADTLLDLFGLTHSADPAPRAVLARAAGRRTAPAHRMARIARRSRDRRSPIRSPAVYVCLRVSRARQGALACVPGWLLPVHERILRGRDVRLRGARGRDDAARRACVDAGHVRCVRVLAAIPQATVVFQEEPDATQALGLGG